MAFSKSTMYAAESTNVLPSEIKSDPGIRLKESITMESAFVLIQICRAFVNDCDLAVDSMHEQKIITKAVRFITINFNTLE